MGDSLPVSLANSRSSLVHLLLVGALWAGNMLIAMDVVLEQSKEKLIRSSELLDWILHAKVLQADHLALS